VTQTVAQRLNERWEEIHELAPQLSRSSALDAVKRLAGSGLDPELPPLGRISKQLNELAQRCAATIRALDSLDKQVAGLFDDAALRSFRESLVEFRDYSLYVMPTHTTPSGGSSAKRAEREIKEAAAEWGRKFLQDEGLRPTLTVNGAWIRLTEILYEVATGRECGGAYRACRAVRGSD
jgi:hypothetical protein